VTLPINLKISVYKLLQHLTSYQQVVQARIEQLVKLDERMRVAFAKLTSTQDNKYFDKKPRKQSFKEGDFVLMWDKRHEKSGDHRKFDSLSLRPFKMEAITGPNTFYLSHWMEK